MNDVDREYRDWPKSLSKPAAERAVDARTPFSDEAANFLDRIATDGTLKAAFREYGEQDAELADQ